jgi:hypothetical protein
MLPFTAKKSVAFLHREGSLRLMRSSTGFFATSVVVFATLVGACKGRAAPSTSPADAGVSPIGWQRPDGAAPIVLVDSGPPASGIPVPASKVESAVNPGHLPPYAGPTGVIEGLVTISGDPAPKEVLDIPFACGEAYATYGKAYREGTGRALADALIAVTRYEGYVPAAGDVVPIKIRGCAYERRTLDVTFGQHIEVTNADPKESYLPTLLGAMMPAQMAAMPGGDPVKLYPTQVGHYALSDDAHHKWMYADVFVVPFSTHAVTGLDGRYRIAGIPAGKPVRISMYAPTIDMQLHPDHGIASVTQERDVEVKPGETVQVDFTLAYKTPKPRPKPKEDPNRPIIK